MKRYACAFFSSRDFLAPKKPFLRTLLSSWMGITTVVGRKASAENLLVPADCRTRRRRTFGRRGGGHYDKEFEKVGMGGVGMEPRRERERERTSFAATGDRTRGEIKGREKQGLLLS